MKELSYFFNLSQSRQLILEDNVSRVCPDFGKNKLLDVCRARWIERIYGMDVFEELFVPIVISLEQMDVNVDRKSNTDTSAKAGAFLKLLTSYNFIVAIVISRNILDLTLPVTQLLQAKSNDIMDGIHLIESLINVVYFTRANADSYHAEWYEKGVTLAQKVFVDDSRPRNCIRQQHSGNVPAEKISDYYKRVITIPFLDHLNSQVKLRFDETALNAFYGLSVVPAKMISLLYRPGKYTWQQKFKFFAEQYRDDLPNYFALDA